MGPAHGSSISASQWPSPAAQSKNAGIARSRRIICTLLAIFPRRVPQRQAGQNRYRPVHASRGVPGHIRCDNGPLAMISRTSGEARRASSPGPCRTGSPPSAQRPPASRPNHLWRTAISRASTPACATHCSMARSSIRSPKPESSWRVAPALQHRAPAWIARLQPTGSVFIPGFRPTVH